MLQRTLAVLLVLLWVVVFGFDQFQDLDFSAQLKFKNAQKAILPGIAKVATLANDNSGNGNHTLTPRAEVSTPPAFHSTAPRLFQNGDFKTDLKIHKLQRVFQI